MVKDVKELIGKLETEGIDSLKDKEYACLLEWNHRNPDMRFWISYATVKDKKKPMFIYDAANNVMHFLSKVIYHDGKEK